MMRVATFTLLCLVVWYATMSVFMSACEALVLEVSGRTDDGSVIVGTIDLMLSVTEAMPLFVTALILVGISRTRLQLRISEAAAIGILVTLVVAGWGLILGNYIPLNLVGLLLFLLTIAIGIRTPAGSATSGA